MRPTYETSRDKERERAVAELISRSWVCDVAEAARYSPYDLELYRGRALKALVEIKTRSTTFGTYNDYFISEKKVLRCLAKAKRLGVPFFLCVEFADGVYYISGLDIGCSVAVKGRYDRADLYDLENVLSVPWEVFRVL